MVISRTTQAVRRVHAGESVRDVARDLDISESAIYAQIKRERASERCPCCEQIVRDGFKINRAALKPGTLARGSK